MALEPAGEHRVTRSSGGRRRDQVGHHLWMRMPRPVLMLRLPGGDCSLPPSCAAQAGPAARPLLTRRVDGGRGCHLAGRDPLAGRGRGRGPGAGQRRRATQRKVRAVLPALPRSESAPRSCPRCSPRPARSPLLRAHPRSSLRGPPPGSAFVVRWGCRAHGSRVRAVAPRDLGQRAAGPPRARAGAQAGGLCAPPYTPSRSPQLLGTHR